VQVAIDAVRAAREPHSFMGVTEQGLAAIVETGGNPSAHVVLRGGTPGPNHDSATVRRTLDALAAASLPAHIVIDLSHGNSLRDHARQPAVARSPAAICAASSASWPRASSSRGGRTPMRRRSSTDRASPTHALAGIRPSRC
jgi:3-deoxy-7-phosphoheptulonate synthase